MKGFNTHRHKTNPKEKELHDEFVKKFAGNYYHHDTIHNLVFGHDDKTRPNDYLHDREKRIVISTIQWLGSSVGQLFLRDCGFKLENIE